MMVDAILLNCPKLRGLITEKYASQSAFADEIGVTKQYLSDILKGEKNFSYSVLCKMVDKLNLNPDEIKLVFFTEKVPKLEQ